MDLHNHTPYPAGIFRAIIDDKRLVASVLTRITFDVRDGQLVPSAKQIWIVSGPPWDSPYGPMASDEVFQRGGVDLFLFGHARAPRARQLTEMDINIRVGDWRRTVRVIGDRVWQRVGRQLVPSRPLPFVEMPLTLERAFGGKGEWDGLTVNCPDNEVGRGFYLEEEQAERHPLPNLENPQMLVKAWTDRPTPAGFGLCPMTSPLRMRNALELDESGQVKNLRPTLFNAAFPDMILDKDKVRPGTVIQVDGVLSQGPLVFRLPDTSPRVRLAFDDEIDEQPLAIDQIGIEADQARVFVAYRFPFRYILYPLQRRRCELFEGGATKKS